MYAFSRVFLDKGEGISGQSFENNSRHTVIECNEFAFCCSRKEKPGECSKPIVWQERSIQFKIPLSVDFAARCRAEEIYTCRMFFGSIPGQIALKNASINTNFLDLKKNKYLFVSFNASNIGKKELVTVQAFARILRVYNEGKTIKKQKINDIAIKDFSLKPGESRQGQIILDFNENGLYEVKLVLQERNDITDYAVKAFKVEVIGETKLDNCKTLSFSSKKSTPNFCQTVFKCENCSSGQKCIEKWKIEKPELIGKTFFVSSNNEFWVEGLPNNESCEQPLLDFCETACTTKNLKQDIINDLREVSNQLNVVELSRDVFSVSGYAVSRKNFLFGGLGGEEREFLLFTRNKRLKYVFFRPESAGLIGEAFFFKVRPGVEVVVGSPGFSFVSDFRGLVERNLRGVGSELVRLSGDRLSFEDFYGKFSDPGNVLLEKSFDYISGLYNSLGLPLSERAVYQLFSLDGGNLLFFYNDVTKSISFIAWKQQIPETDFKTIDFTQGPCIPPKAIQEKLLRENSPAQDKALLIYSKGKEKGVDPAVALAFYDLLNNFGKNFSRNWFGLTPFSSKKPFACSTGKRNGLFCDYTAFDESLNAFYDSLKEVAETKGKTLDTLINAFNEISLPGFPKLDYETVLKKTEFYRRQCTKEFNQKRGAFVLKAELVPGSNKALFHPFTVNASGLGKYHGMYFFNGLALNFANNQARVEVLPDNAKLYTALNNQNLNITKPFVYFDEFKKFCENLSPDMQCSLPSFEEWVKNKFFYSKKISGFCNYLKEKKFPENILENCSKVFREIKDSEKKAFVTEYNAMQKVCSEISSFNRVSSNSKKSCSISLAVYSQQLGNIQNIYYSLSEKLCNSIIFGEPEVMENKTVSPKENFCFGIMREKKILSKYFLDCNPKINNVPDLFIKAISFGRLCMLKPVGVTDLNPVANYNQALKENLFDNACVDPNIDNSKKPIKCVLKAWNNDFTENKEVVLSNSQGPDKSVLIKYYVLKDLFRATEDGYEFPFAISFRQGNGFTPFFSNQEDLTRFLQKTKN